MTLLLALPTFASEVNRRLADINAAITFDPGRESWGKQLESELKGLEGKASTQEEKRRVTLTRNRIQGLAKLSKCLKEKGVKFDGFLRDFVQGSDASSFDLLVDCDYAREIEEQIGRLAQVNDEAMHDIMIEAAMNRVNYEAIRHAWTIAKKYGAEDSMNDTVEVYTTLCNWSMGHRLRGPFCQPDQRAKRLQQIKEIGQKVSAKRVSVQETRAQLKGSADRLNKILDTLPKTVNGRVQFYKATPEDQNYQRYVRAYAEEVSKPHGLLMMVGPVSRGMLDLKMPKTM